MTDDFQLTSRITESGVVHIDVRGDLDAATADRVVNVLGVYLEPITGCIIDLTHCNFIDSSGVRALVLCQLQLESPHRVVLVGTDPRVDRMLSVAGMSRRRPSTVQ